MMKFSRTIFFSTWYPNGSWTVLGRISPVSRPSPPRNISPPLRQIYSSKPRDQPLPPNLLRRRKKLAARPRKFAQPPKRLASHPIPKFAQGIQKD